MTKKYKNYKVVMDYCNGILDGSIPANKERIQGIKRFIKGLEDDRYDFRPKEAEKLIFLIENTFVHRQGESLNGESMRGKPFLLQPFQKQLIYDLLGFWHKGTNTRRFKESFIYIPRKNSKALALDTEIPTPNGWKLLEDINEGDYIFDRKGRPTKVLAQSEIFKGKPTYLITFEDGSKIEATDDHIWTVMTKDSRRLCKNSMSKYHSRKGYFDITTKEMYKDFVHIRKDGKGKEYKYRVPMNKAVEYTEKELLVDPYMLGVWLGDGSKSGNCITCGDEDLEAMQANILESGHTTKVYDKHKRKHLRANVIGVDIGKKYKDIPHTNNLRERLKIIGVYENKHIPEIYMQSSIKQRFELLKGLMDTDGTISKAGQCKFSQSNKSFALSVKELLASLGIKSSIIERNTDGFISWDVAFFVDKRTPVFKLERKLKRHKDKLSNRMPNKSIINIKLIESKDSKCLFVDNEEHLFLVGRDYTVTHNTTFSSALAWGLSLYNMTSGAKCYIVANAMQQARESFDFIKFNIQQMGETKAFRILDSNVERSIEREFNNGSIRIQALASSVERQDSLNCNIAIADELHAYKNSKQYDIIKEAMKAYTNKLMIGITTAGDNMNSFCYKRLQYCQKILEETVEDEQYHVFISKADEDEEGEVDYTNPLEHKKANPMYGITIRPNDILNDSLQAQNDPQSRKNFLAKSLNVYTSSTKSYFNLTQFRISDEKYNWSIEELSKLDIKWYGGADLSKMHDLTATALVGEYQGVLIIITHAFFPVTRAYVKAEEDNIPLFGWKDDGNLTMTNTDVVNYADVVNWFKSMRDKGFEIKQIGFDRKFAEEFYLMMKNERFDIVDEPQLYINKTKGFRKIEQKAISKDLYYMHSEAYEYCVENVHGIEKTDDMIQYEKVLPNMRIDLFDASVFATVRLIHDMKKKDSLKSFLSK